MPSLSRAIGLAGLYLALFCLASMLLGGLKFATSPAFDASPSASAQLAPASKASSGMGSSR